MIPENYLVRRNLDGSSTEYYYTAGRDFILDKLLFSISVVSFRGSCVAVCIQIVLHFCGFSQRFLCAFKFGASARHSLHTLSLEPEKCTVLFVMHEGAGFIPAILQKFY